EQLDDALRRVPVDHVLAEQLVEMRVAVDRVTAEDQSRHRMGTELDRWQRRNSRRVCSWGSRDRRYCNGTGGMVQEVAACREQWGGWLFAHGSSSSGRPEEDCIVLARASHTKKDTAEMSGVPAVSRWFSYPSALDDINLAVIVAVIAVRVVQVPVNEVINVVAVRHRLVTAARAMPVVLVVLSAVVV